MRRNLLAAQRSELVAIHGATQHPIDQVDLMSRLHQSRVPTGGKFMILYRYQVPIVLVSPSGKEPVEIDCCGDTLHMLTDELSNYAA